ncbi:MAG: VWA domain-containing protein [Anaerolineae bacterium]|nr:VWA domain-containing protein [Anaerolineae bacterium]
MGARKRMVAVKGAMLSLLLDAYQKRDRVGLITFRGQNAQMLVSPTNSVELAERQLRQLPTGGRTPLLSALQLADRVVTVQLNRDAALTPLVVLITDGRANTSQPGQIQTAAIHLAQKQLATLVLDSEQGFVRMGLARQLAQWLGARYLLLDELHSESIVRQVRSSLG